MVGWRVKILFLLVVYFAGFVTAIYCLAPVPEDTRRASDEGFVYSAFKSDEFAKSFNIRLHRCVNFAKGSAEHIAVYLRDKFEDKNKADS